MAGHIGLLLANDGQIPFAADLEHLVLLPRAFLPAVDRAGEFAEVDLGVEVGREILAVIARVDVDDVDGFHLVHEFVHGETGEGVHHTGIEACPQNGGGVGLGAILAAFPFVVAVPRGCFADFGRVFVNGRVDIGDTGADAGFKHGHVHEGRTDVNHDLHAQVVDQRLYRVAVHPVDRMGLEYAVLFHRAFGMHAFNDRFAF